MSATRYALLQAAIKQLYVTFARYPLAPEISGCPCCVKAEDQALLRSRRLRELQADELEKYSFKALTTWGSTEDLRHFLPRMFEITAHNPLNPCNVEILFGKLSYGDWHTWPQEEQTAINQYFATLWDFVIHSSRVPLLESHPESYLCAIGLAVNDVQVYLDVWAKSDHPVARVHLRTFVKENIDHVFQGKLSSAFWRGEQPTMQQVIRWLLSPELEQRLEARFMAECDPKQSQVLGTTLDLLHQLRMFAPTLV